MVESALEQAARECIDDFRTEIIQLKRRENLTNRYLAEQTDVTVNTMQTFLSGSYPASVTLKMISLGLCIEY